MRHQKLLSSKSNEWETPGDLFAKLHAVFGFTLDPSCTEVNATCEKFYTQETDGLSKDWSGEVVYCNPPYGRSLADWIKKCADEGKNTTVVMLVPSRTDTKAMQDHCLSEAQAICFVRGRLKFINRTLPSWREDGDFKVSPAPFPSLLAVYSPEPLTDEQMGVLEAIGHVTYNRTLT